MLSGEQVPQWTREDIMNYTEPKFGYTRDTPGFQKFVNVLVSMTGDERKVRTSHLFRFISWHLVSLIRSFVCLVLVRSFVRLFVRSFVRLFVHLFLPSFVRPSVPSFVCSSICSFLRLFVHLFLPSFVRPSVPSFVCSSICSFLRLFVYWSFVRSFVRSVGRSVGRSFGGCSKTQVTGHCLTNNGTTLTPS